MTNVLAVAVDAALVDRITAIRDHRVVSIGRENVDAIRADVPFHPDLILIGDGLTPEQATRYAQRVLSEYPSMVIALVAEPDRDRIREATHAGMRGVISNAISDHELANLIARAGASAPVDAITGGLHQVIVVASPKGGVGKTTVSVNLAALLAERSPGAVVLLDLDLQFGDVSSVVDLQPEFTAAEAFDSGAADSMLLRTLLTPHPAGFHILCGADHPAAAGPVTGDQVRKLVRQFANDFQYVVVDTSAGMQEETLASLEEATDVAFVGTMDVATLRNLRKEIDVLAELGLLPERRHLVLNRMDRFSGLTQRDAENIVGMHADALIPAAANIPLAANHGRLAIQERKRNKMRQPLEKFVRAISAQTRRGGKHL